jgi:hypothetical protein
MSKKAQNYLFVCGSFNDAFNTELSVVTNVVITNKSLIGKDMAGQSCVLRNEKNPRKTSIK